VELEHLKIKGEVGDVWERSFGEVLIFFLGGKKSENMAREKALTPEMVSKMIMNFDGFLRVICVLALSLSLSLSLPLKNTHLYLSCS
jgi:hypothetical protein